MAAGVQLVAKPKHRVGRRLAPYLLTLPGGLWLLLFVWAVVGLMMESRG